MTSTALLVLQRLILRSARPPLLPLWRLLYRALTYAGAAYLARGGRGTAVYARGGHWHGPDFLPGLSDVDLVVLPPGDAAGPGLAAERVRSRWERLRTRIPGIMRVLDRPRIHEPEELDSIAGASALTYGLGAERPPHHVFLGARANFETQRALLRPGVYGAFDGWRRVRGPDWLPASPEPDLADRRIAAWLEIASFWRLVFAACIDPRTPRSADVCLKAVAESARAWMWVAHDERAGDRGQVLNAALRLLPEEEPGLRRALTLRRGLRTAVEAPLDELLPVALRIAGRVAALLEEGGDARAQSVRLVGRSDDRGELPLLDWRALSDPAAAEERFLVLGGSPGDPARLRDLAQAHPDGPFPALFENDLMVLPSSSPRRGWLRTIQCPVTDPVSFALAAGRDVAEFPATRGWCAADVAGRAVIEHRAWFQAPPGALRGSPEDPGGHTLEMLLTGARASLFLSSLREGDPELCLSVEEIARRLRGAVADDAVAAHRAYISAGTDPSGALLAALRGAVEGLPAYADPSASIRSKTAGRSAMT